MVGLDRLELSTSPLSGVRSNHLSYRPSTAPGRARALKGRIAKGTDGYPRRKRNEGGSARTCKGDRIDYPILFLKRIDRSKLLKIHP